MHRHAYNMTEYILVAYGVLPALYLYCSGRSPKGLVNTFTVLWVKQSILTGSLA